MLSPSASIAGGGCDCIGSDCTGGCCSLSSKSWWEQWWVVLIAKWLIPYTVSKTESAFKLFLVGGYTLAVGWQSMQFPWSPCSASLPG